MKKLKTFTGNGSVESSYDTGRRETLGKHLSKSKPKARIGMASIVDDVYILMSPQHCVDQHDSSISSRRKGVGSKAKGYT
jgi:hypothetical protein